MRWIPFHRYLLLPSGKTIGGVGRLLKSSDGIFTYDANGNVIIVTEKTGHEVFKIIKIGEIPGGKVLFQIIPKKYEPKQSEHKAHLGRVIEEGQTIILN